MKKILFILITLVVVVFITYQQRIPHKQIGNYLSPSDNLSKADAIVVVSGSGERVDHAVELYKKGLAPKLIFSGAAKEGSSNALAMQIEAVKVGVPKEIIFLEEKATNTYENALLSKEIILQENFKSIILVTSPYHQRRTYESFQIVLKDKNVTIQNSPAEESNWKPNTWWINEETRGLTFTEIGKLAWSKVTGNYRK